MRNEVFQIARTMVDRAEVRRWLDHIGANGYEIPSDEDVTAPALLIALAAKRCYLSFEVGLNPNVTKIRKNLVDYLDNVLASGHGSVLEHSVYSFAIEGISRVGTGELNRHRAGVGISEGSMRFIRYTDIPYWLPTSLRDAPDDSPELRAKKEKSRVIFRKHFLQTEENYAALQSVWASELAPKSTFHGKKHITSMMRRIIPMGVATGGVWTMNLRAVRHIIALRASEAAEEEILFIFSRIAKMMVENEPMLFGDFAQDDKGFWIPKYKKV